MTKAIRIEDHHAVIEAAAARLQDAEASGQPCAPVADLLGREDIALAYQVQQRVIGAKIAGGARVVGRKIGLTSRAVQAQIGVDRPDFGVLLDDMAYASGEEVPFERLLQPKAEAEIAFVLKSDILQLGTRAALIGAIARAHAALEIVDSRIADWKIGITDTVADNASSGVFVISDQWLELDAFDPVATTMVMTRNGQEVSHGRGADCLDDPLKALAWLAQTAIDLGEPLRAGEIVLSGALGPMVAIAPGDHFAAVIAPLGEVSLKFSNKGERQ